MTKLTATLFTVFILINLISRGQDLDYPPTIKRERINVYHGQNVYDDYQWLENVYSPEVRIWVENEKMATDLYLKKLVNQHNSKNLMNSYMAQKRSFAISTLYNFDNERVTNYRLFHNDYYSGPSIYYREHSYSKYKLLVDSRYLYKNSEDKISDIINFSPSQDDSYLAFQYIVNEEPWGEIQIQSTNNSNSPKETLHQTNLNPIKWYKDGIFYQKSTTDSLLGMRVSPEIYYHQLNTSQSKDSLVFKTNNAQDELSLHTTFEENIYFLEIENRPANQFSYLYWKPDSQFNGFKPIVYKVNYSFTYVDYIDGRLILKAIINDKPQLISLDPDNPKDLKIISKDYPNAIMSKQEVINKEKIAVSYQALNQPYLSIIKPDGTSLGEFELPSGVTITNLSYQKESDELFFLLESFTIPPVICKVDFTNYTYKIQEKTGVGFDFKKYKYDEITVETAPGIHIPVFIVYKNKLKLDGNTPMLLEAFGGLGANSSARYNPDIIYFLENGGAYAFAHTRGGGEFGNSWWKAGKNLNKENAITDYLGIAKYLVNNKYTSKQKIGLMGSSHGALLASVAFIREPDLFGAVLINDCLSDMLRYETNPHATTLIDEFGSTSNKEEFYNLAEYSPYHHINPNLNYPPTLIHIERDDQRISAMHSYKLAAIMQNNPSQTAPVLLLTHSSISKDRGQSLLDHVETESQKMAFLHHFLLQP